MLSAANRVHSNIGTDGTQGAPVTTVTPTLAGADQTDEHNTVLAWHATAAPIDTPGDWVSDVSSTAVMYAFRRPVAAVGESSWPFTITLASYSAWRVEEWTGVDLIDPVDVSVLGTLTPQGTASCSTGTTSATSADGVAAIAAWVLTRGSAGVGVWPAGRSCSNGFSVVSFHSLGTGNAAGDRALVVAEFWPTALGTLETTLTLDTSGGGSLSTLSMVGMIVAYRPAAVVDVPPGVLTAPSSAM